MFGDNLDTSNLLSAEAMGILRGLLQQLRTKSLSMPSRPNGRASVSRRSGFSTPIPKPVSEDPRSRRSRAGA